MADIIEQILSGVLSSTSSSPGASGVLLLSVGYNAYQYYLIQKLNETQDGYLGVFKDLEPILTKILNKEKLLPCDIHDITRIRDLIKNTIGKNGS